MVRRAIATIGWAGIHSICRNALPKAQRARACTGAPALETAVKEAGSLDQDAVIDALDHAKIAVGPGGPTEMVPGQHHVRMNMYIAQVQGGGMKIIKSLGVVDPDEATVTPHD